MMNWKEFGLKQLWPNFKAISRYWSGGTEKNPKNLSQDIRPPGRGLSPGPLEYAAGVLTTRPRRLVTTYKYFSLIK
jgi:hypothetical protein